VWAILHDKDAVGPVAKLQAMFNALPAPGAKNGAGSLAVKTAAMENFVTRIRAHTAMQFSAPVVKGLPGQSEPLHNWRLEQYAQGHRKSDPNALRAANEPEPALQDIPKYPPLHEDASPRWAILMAHARHGDADLVYPAGQKARYQAAFSRFASVFPDTFVVSERGRYWPDQATDNGRLLSAGYHNTGGYYRDDTALRELILDKKGTDQLNGLWNEFDFVGRQTEHTWVQYFFNQSGEVDGNINGPLSSESGSKRPVGHEVTDAFVINQMREKYLARWAMDKEHNDPIAPRAFNWHFGLINATLRDQEKQRAAAEPKQVAALVRFAERAYRRPLTANERTDLLAYYKKLRTKNALAAAKRRGVKLGNPNGARALRGKQTGNAEAVAKIKANAVQRAQGLTWIVEDITRSGVTTVRGIAEELNRRGVHAPRGDAWHPTAVSRLLSRLKATA